MPARVPNNAANHPAAQDDPHAPGSVRNPTVGTSSPGTPSPAETAVRLVAEHGTTFAEEAGITLTNTPGPLWQLLVLANLLSNRIRSDAAIASAHELWLIGCDTPAGTRDSRWQQRVDALGRGGYRRYDFSTSTRLGKNADLVAVRYLDDLTELPRTSVSVAVKALQEFDGIGPAGVRIFLREAQSVWPSLGFQVDKLTEKGATACGLPTSPDELGALVPSQQWSALAAALVRVAREGVT